ncbi:thiol reductant ABC exporter subunit CydD [Reticulibacter mediterranei]|uniref:Thiol reductant ABC exporter subunit CydD n=1 Tax=Reticulibacter mediterranei TaxID=2778369 RepID=A0A8J3IT75_9CHLR|nr:thiol reductant ABC exporter subunit CydD [Reticulibacter mediterranei]GHP00332.1 thiol reductant ABC exporter subunit CydD [Reticulibacter mediterranei]
MNKRLLHEIRHIHIYLAATALFAATMGLLIIVQARLLTRAIDGVFLKGQALAQVVSLLSMLVGVVIGRAILIWSNSVVAAHAATTVKSSLRQRLFAHIQALGPVALSKERSGELTTTLVEGVEALDAFFSQMLPQVCATLLIPCIIGLVVFLTDALSGLILLITTPILLLFMFLIGTLAETHTKKQWGLLSSMSAHFLDVLQGLTTLKMFGRSHRQQETIARISDHFRKTTMSVLRVAFLSSLVLELGATLSTALVAVEIGLRLLYNQIPFSVAFFVLLLAPDFYLPLRTLGTKFHASMNSAASAKRIYELLDTPVASLSASEVAYPEGQPMPTVRFQNVSYTYQDQAGDERQALRDVSLILEQGQTIALVGASGAGKSTLAHLLLRFIEPQQGTIVVGTRPLETIPVQVWRRQIAWIPQRPYLSHGSIAENIRIGCTTATMEQIIRAAQQAHLHEFIQSLPCSYDTQIGERGVRLSGGQIQRLALARVFLKDAPLLILDEATAHLDEESEQVVLKSLQTFLKNRTTLIIAHRLHTLREVDRVVMLEEGRVVADGPHERLMAQSPAYQRMASAYQRKEAIWKLPSGVC